jgi:hypothetical protein
MAKSTIKVEQTVGWAKARMDSLDAWAKSRTRRAHAVGIDQAILPTLRVGSVR